MPADHKEIAFEAAIEGSLLTHGGFIKGDPEAFDRELALDRGELFEFLRGSQPKTWAKLEGLLGPRTEATVLDNLLGALADRGLLAPGYLADVNVIDLDRLKLGKPWLAFDLPAGGKRLLQTADGYTATIKSGAVTFRNGAVQAARPGRVVRGPQAEPLLMAAE